MLRAIYNGNPNTLARPHLKGVCPHCGEEVFARCGTHNEWHWSHKSTSQCFWLKESLNEGVWHKRMKNLFPLEWQEIYVPKNGKYKIADVLPRFGESTNIPSVEFQNSRISPEELKYRCDFYGEVTWVFNLKAKWFKGVKITNKQDWFQINLPEQLRFMHLINTRGELIFHHYNANYGDRFFVVDKLCFGYQKIGGYCRKVLKTQEFVDRMSGLRETIPQRLCEIIVHKRWDEV